MEFKAREEKRVKVGGSFSAAESHEEASANASRPAEEDDPLGSSKLMYGEGGDGEDSNASDRSWLGVVKHGFATDPMMVRE